MLSRWQWLDHFYQVSLTIPHHHPDCDYRIWRRRERYMLRMEKKILEFIFVMNHNV